MKTIALEEHYRYPGIKETVARWNPALLKEIEQAKALVAKSSSGQKP